MKTILDNCYLDKGTSQTFNLIPSPRAIPLESTSPQLARSARSNASESFSLPLSYSHGKGSTSVDVMPPVSQTIFVAAGSQGSATAAGSVDDSASLSTGSASATSPSGPTHPFDLSITDLPAGVHNISVTHSNIEHYPDPVGNISRIEGNLTCTGSAIDIVPEYNDELEDDPCADVAPCGASAGGQAPQSQLTRSLLRSTSVLSDLSPSYTTSSAAQSMSREINNEFMRWSCLFGAFRGMTDVPFGRLEIIGYSFSEQLFSPASLSFDHPLASAVANNDLMPSTDSGGTDLGPKSIAANQGLRIQQGGKYVNYATDGQGGSAFGVGASKKSTSKVDYVQSATRKGGDNRKDISEASYMRVSSASGTARFFNKSDASFDSFVTRYDYKITSDESSKYIRILRHATTGNVRQIWNYWDGLADIVDAPAGEIGYSISFYTCSQITAYDGAEGIYTTTGAPFKVIHITGDVAARTLTITEQDSSMPSSVLPLVTTWTEQNGAWSMTTGMGESAIHERHVKEDLPPTDEGYPCYRIIKTLFKIDAQGEEHIATCTASTYAVATTGKRIIERIDGYGSEHTITTTYSYNHYTGQLLHTSDTTGAIYEYSYDQRGRVRSALRPWKQGRGILTATRYVDDESEFAEDIAREEVIHLLSNGKMAQKSLTLYTYSRENSIKRTEARSTATGSSHTQLAIDETWMGDAPNIYARGRTRMTQGVDGVQTWHDYEASSLHGALYVHSLETRVADSTVLGQSVRHLEYVSQQGNTTREEHYALLADGTWALTHGMTHSYDVQNRRIATIYDNGRSSSRAYMCSGELLWEIDESGVRLDNAFDSARTHVETTRAATPTTPETIIEWVKDAASRTLQTRKHLGALITTESTLYDTLGRIVSSTDTLGRTSTMSYSTDGLISTTITPSGATLITRRNPDGSIAEQSGTGQRHLHYHYDLNSGNERTTVKLSDNSTILSQQILNGFGDPITITQPTSIANGYLYTRSEYNEKGQLTRQRTGSFAPTLYSYDSMGNQVKQTLLLDESTPDSVTSNRVQLKHYSTEQLADGIYSTITATRYNAEGTALISRQKTLISSLSDLLESNTITISERGLTTTEEVRYTGSLMERLHLTSVPTSDTVATATVVDGYTTAQSDHAGGSWSYTRQFLSTGILVTQTDPRGNTSSTQSDLAGRPIIQTDGAGSETTTTYSSCCDQPASVTDTLGHTINYRYDVRSRKVAEYGTAIQPATYAYDDADRMITLTTYRVVEGDISTDPSERSDGDSTTWSYHDATGLELSKTFADASQETRRYNGHNQLISVTSARGITTTLSYDSLSSDLLELAYSDDTPEQTYAYNTLGQATSITDASGTHTFTYNSYGEAHHSTQRVHSTDFTVEEQYDEYGRSAGYLHKRGTTDMQVVTTGYDTKGRIGTASFKHSGAVKEFTYSYLDGTSLLSQLTSPNGITRELTYEAQRNLVTDINDMRGASGVSLREYSYDTIARPITRKISRKGTIRDDSFTYNTRSELTAATHGANSFAYDYDNIGNRKTAQEHAEEITYSANELNEYTVVNDFIPEFDADGNQTRLQTSTGIWIVEYSAENRPVKFTSEEGSTLIESAYDYMGRRAWKKTTVDGEVTAHEGYLYRGYLQIACIDLTRSTLNGLYYLIWDPSEPTATRPLALQRYGSWFTFGLDISKNVKELFNPSSSVVTTYDYSPFGAASRSGSTKSPVQWSSEITDDELGLAYYNYRHYNPTDGRWINRDPIAEQGGLNLYSFVGNKIWNTDQIGHASSEWKLDLIPTRGVCGTVQHRKLPCGTIQVLYEEWMEPGFFEQLWLGAYTTGKKEWRDASDDILDTYFRENRRGELELVTDSNKLLGREIEKTYENLYVEEQMTIGNALVDMATMPIGNVTSGLALTKALNLFDDILFAGKKAINVTFWGRAADRPAGWVMKGNATKSNHIRSFKGWNSWGNQAAKFNQSTTITVPRSKVSAPKGGLLHPDGPFFKGLFGQRIYTP